MGWKHVIIDNRNESGMIGGMDNLPVFIGPPLVVGSVVALNSGGPWLTVTCITNDGIVCVSWIDEGSQFHSQAIPSAAVRMKTSEDE